MQFLNKNFFLSWKSHSFLFIGLTSSLLAWTSAVQVSEEASSTNPTPSYLTIDENSNAFLGWLHGEIGTGTDLISAALPAGAPNWNSPFLLYSGTSPEFPSFPILFALNSGKVHALWSNFHLEEEAADATTVAIATLDSLNGDWSSPILSSTLSGFPNNGAIGADKLGNQLGVLALGADSNTYTPPYSINLVAYANDSPGWTTPVNLGTDNSATSAAIFAAAAEGEAVIGWRIGPAPSLSLHTARYTFSTEELIPINDIPLPSGTIDVGFAKAVLAENGNAIALFGVQFEEGTNYVIYSSFLPAGSDTWTFPEIVSNPDNNTTGIYLDIKVDPLSNATLLWGELKPSNNCFVRTAFLAFGGNLTNIVNLTDPDSITATPSSDPSGLLLSEDNFGNNVAIWNFNISDAPSVQVASKPFGGVWTSAQTLSSSGFLPRVALSNQGTAIAAWLDSSNHFVYSSRSDQLFPLASPSAFGGYVTEEGADQILNFHWSASLAPNIISYEIYKDNVLIANISAEGPFTFQYLLECGALESDYTLVAVASNGNKSTPLALTLVD
ncbi:MAG: hypothetical protein Q8K60_09350 [Parachlamydiaceae bacterium]|nr:hypothetical protein [Parachlamydiaceae bacterium]